MVVKAKEAWQITRQGFYRPAYVDEYQREHEMIANRLAHNANFMSMACAIVERGINKALLKDAKHGGDILPVYMTLTTDTHTPVMWQNATPMKTMLKHYYICICR